MKYPKISLLLFFLCFTFSCLEREVYIKFPYHPYLSKYRCQFSILSNVNSINSVSIVLNDSNILDLDEQEIEAKGIVVDKNSEYQFSKIPKKLELFNEIIPCKKQIIRLRYQFADQEKNLDLVFKGNSKQKFIINEGKNGELFYVSR